jgi:hypothetical protein
MGTEVPLAVLSLLQKWRMSHGNDLNRRSADRVAWWRWLVWQWPLVQQRSAITSSRLVCAAAGSCGTGGVLPTVSSRQTSTTAPPTVMLSALSTAVDSTI